MNCSFILLLQNSRDPKRYYFFWVKKLCIGSVEGEKNGTKTGAKSVCNGNRNGASVLGFRFCVKKKKKNSERVNFFERALTGCFMTLIKALRFFLPPLPSLSEERPTEQVNRLVCTIYSYNRLYNVPRSFCYLTGGFLWGS